MSEMPHFNYDGCSIKNDEEMAEELAKTQGNDKFFKPGKHDVIVESVEFTGLAKNDDTWGNLEVTYKGTNEKTLKDFVMIPFKDVAYGPKKTLFPFKKLTQFCGALGVELKVSNLKETMTSTFGKPEKLVGKALSIDVGYERAYAKWAGKDESGASQYHLILQDGNPYAANGTVQTFPDYASVAAFAEAKKIAYDKFCRVTSYYPGVAKVADANW